MTILPPTDFSRPHGWLIIVKRSVSEQTGIMPDRIIARIVKCWPRIKMFDRPRDDDARFGAIIDDELSWFICFSQKVSPKYGDKLCAYVIDVKTARPSDYEHLPESLRPVTDKRIRRLIARSAPQPARPLPVVL